MMRSRGFVTTAATRAHRAALGGHLWHTIEAVAFLVFALGGIALAEYIQARGRGTTSTAVQARPRVAVAAGGGLPERPLTSPDLAPALRRAEPRNRSTLLPLVALAGAAAAAVHFVVMPEHFEEATLYGAFFATAASAQLLYSGWLLARPSRTLLAAGALGNLSIVVLWLVTRTIGIPLGPAAGSTESFGGLDVLATIFEVTTAAGAIVLLVRRQPMLRAIRPSTWSPLIWVVGSSAAIAIAVTAYLSPPS